MVQYNVEVVSVRMFLVTLLVLVLSTWIFEVEVEAQKIDPNSPSKLSSFTVLFSIIYFFFT